LPGEKGHLTLTHIGTQIGHYFKGKGSLGKACQLNKFINTVESLDLLHYIEGPVPVLRDDGKGQKLRRDAGFGLNAGCGIYSKFMALYGKVAGNLAEYGICDSEKRANSSSI
jgi:hypothetical protein